MRCGRVSTLVHEANVAGLHKKFKVDGAPAKRVIDNRPSEAEMIECLRKLAGDPAQYTLFEIFTRDMSFDEQTAFILKV